MAAAELIDRALQQRWLSLGDLTALVLGNVGRRGVGQVRELLRQRRGGEWSGAERVLTGLLRSAGIQGWRTNAPIADGAGVIGVGDVVFAAHQLVLEVDGWAFHVTTERFQRDRTRQNRLVLAGWTVLRFTWSDLILRGDVVIATVRRSLLEHP